MHILCEIFIILPNPCLLTASFILEFFSANELDDRPFIVMPYLRNGNVRDYIRARPGCDRLGIVYLTSFVEIFTVLIISTQIHHICLGLVYLHSQSIIHGDLKGVSI